MAELVRKDHVEEILFHISCQPNISPETLSSALWFRISTIQTVLQLCENTGVIRKTEDGYKINPKAQERLQLKDWQIRKLCPECYGRGIIVPTKEYDKTYRELFSKRVNPDRVLNQWQAHIESVYARVAYLIGDRAVRRKKVLFTGDSDFASVGVALYGDPREVVVVDIDDRIIETYSNIAAEMDIPLIVLKHDLNERLPSKFQNAFDTTFGDPPYALAGIMKWIERAIDALKTDGRGYLAIPYGDALLQGSGTMGMVSEYLATQHFAITSLKHGFHTYEGVDGQRSSMLRFEEIRHEYSLPKGPIWPDVPRTAERLVNVPKYDEPELTDFLDYLSGK